MPHTTKQTRNAKLFQHASSVGYTLLEIADRLEWIFSRQNYLEFAEYEDHNRRQLLKEQRQYLHYLKRQKLIEIKRIGATLNIRLTEKGWAEALRNKIKSTNKRCKNGICYFVIFDVPEKERRTRNALRNFLKECGFKKIQHSVWMTDREVLQPLRKLLQRRKLEQWIKIVAGNIVATSTIDQLKILHKFR